MLVTPTLRRWLACASAALIALGASLPALGQTGQPTKIIVPYPVGGSTDLLARALTKGMTERGVEHLIVDNRAGANGNIGAAAVAQAKPDGATLLFSTTGPLSLNKLLYANTPFDPLTDFAPIIRMADVPLVLAAHPSFPARTLPELIAYVKANPGKVAYSTAGQGSMGHLAAELLQRQAGLRMVHVPYRGSAPALNDLVAGVVPLSFDLVPTYLPQIRAGKAVALATLGAKRIDVLRDTPTLVESGIDAVATGWSGLAAPAGTPAARITELNAAANAYLATAEAQALLAGLGMQASGGSPDDFGRFIQAEMHKWEPIVAPLAAQLNTPTP